MTEQFGDEQTANTLEFGGIANTNSRYGENFTTTTAAKNGKNR